MTSIGILGAGRVGANLAGKLAAAGHHVVLGRRDPDERTPALTGTTGPRVSFSDQRTTARTTDVVINATPGDSALDRLTGLRAELAGKILVDVSNATRDTGGLPGDLCYPGSSLAERLQAALPDTRVVKTLNTMLYMVMTAPGMLATPPTVYVSGDDASAKTTVTGLLGDLGWQPGWIEDLGDITTARATEAMILVVPHVLRRHGLEPFAVSLAR
ncbi:NADP oxidoreductase [Streptomyces dangxiongensis]|uniref:NADP oxidoreductase n=1 Tax=Streptomyces dangxiongensis TaxID=1442032 RepID=A0A3G2JK93_9ACTN|nr:NAD(P)-binding domain-containing protein [Streptomyces dangxiongensis]AYN42041.1 NADP oxidoreductase [Streptomyces dangxiongensis]